MYLVIAGYLYIFLYSFPSPLLSSFSVVFTWTACALESGHVLVVIGGQTFVGEDQDSPLPLHWDFNALLKVSMTPPSVKVATAIFTDSNRQPPDLLAAFRYVLSGLSLLACSNMSHWWFIRAWGRYLWSIRSGFKPECLDLFFLTRFSYCTKDPLSKI